MLSIKEESNTKYFNALKGSRFFWLILVSRTNDVINMNIYANKSIDSPTVVPGSVVINVRFIKAPISELKIYINQKKVKGKFLKLKSGIADILVKKKVKIINISPNPKNENLRDVKRARVAPVQSKKRNRRFMLIGI